MICETSKEEPADSLKEWQTSDLANIVLIHGNGGKALCAGGDVAALALKNKEGATGQQTSKDYFGLEYKLDYTIATYGKPYIAIMDGITMGGGVGLSVHAPFRIATEKTVFAMPETTIGFFPDVGGSFFLPRLDGELGTYLALTSERLNGVQALYGGIATHYLDSSALPGLINRLSELTFADSTGYTDRLQIIDNTIAEFASPVPEKRIKLGGAIRSAIDRCFSADSIAEIITRLEAESADNTKQWAEQTLETLKSRSPTSLKVTLKQLRLGAKWDIAQTFQREHQIASQFMEHPDFVEGVSSKLINKPATTPVWNPATLEEVDDSVVDAFFARPDQDKILQLEDGGHPQPQYKDYPHTQFALPRERVVEEFVKSNPHKPLDVVKRFVIASKQKPGVWEKVTEICKRKMFMDEEGAWRWKD